MSTAVRECPYVGLVPVAVLRDATQAEFDSNPLAVLGGGLPRSRYAGVTATA